MAKHCDEARRETSTSCEVRERFKYCRDLSSIVYHDCDVEGLRQAVLEKGAQLQMAWPAKYGKAGFAALTALVVPDGEKEDVLVVAFRGTVGLSEWREYLSIREGTFRPLYDDADPVVLPVWMEVVDRMWDTQGINVDAELIQAGRPMVLRESVLDHLSQGKPVWLTGHSKGSAVATTIAANLICGQSSVTHAAHLPGLSVATFSSPLVFKTRFARIYQEARGRFRIEHLRFQHKNDVVPKIPPWLGLTHVGRKVENEESQSYGGSCDLEAQGISIRSTAAVYLEQVLKATVRMYLNHAMEAVVEPVDDKYHGSIQPSNRLQGELKTGEPVSRDTNEGVPTTVMIVGKSGSGKSTLGNHLLNAGVTPDDFKLHFAEGGGARGITDCVEDHTSTDGSLRVIDTPGIPDPSTISTLEYFDIIVQNLRSQDSINLLIFLVSEDRTNEQQFNHYRVLVNQFNYLPCEKLMVCRQSSYTHSSRTAEAEETKRNEGIGFAKDILARSSMDMPFMLHSSGRGDEAKQSLARIVNYARVCRSVSLCEWASLRTYRELKTFVRRLASRKDRLKALKFEVQAQRRLVDSKKRWMDLSSVHRVCAESFMRYAPGVSGVGKAILSPFLYYIEVTSDWAAVKLENAERELADKSVDEGLLHESQKELKELEELTL